MNTSSQKKSLAHAFTKAAIAGLFVASTSTAYALDLPKVPPQESNPRPLTQGELYYAGVFGAEVDAEIIEYHAGPNKNYSAGQIVAQTFNSYQVAYYGHPFLSLDYAVDNEPLRFGSHMHELVHIWQFQTGEEFTPKGHCNFGHGYDLKAGDTFADFCDEKQASILEDYSRRYLMPERPHRSHWYFDKAGCDSFENDALLLETVETRFPKAREMREKIGRTKVLPDACPAPFKMPEKEIVPEKQPESTPEKKKPEPEKKPAPEKKPEKKPEPKAEPKKPAPEKKPEKKPEPKAEPKKPAPEKKPEKKPEPKPKKKKPEFDDEMQKVFDEAFKKDPNEGKPAFYCEALSVAFNNISGFVEKQNKSNKLKFKAELDSKNPHCNVYNYNKKIIAIKGEDFTDYGLIEEAPLTKLAKLFSGYVAREDLDPLRGFLSEQSNKVKKDLARKKVTDPSNPDRDRMFLFEQIRLYGAVEKALKNSTLPTPAINP
jgi:hypothetical protein